MVQTQTLDEDALRGLAPTPTPGLILIFSEAQPQCTVIPLGERPVEIGRGVGERLVTVHDDRVSRRHARVVLHGETVRVSDLSSRNGTLVDGSQVTDRVFPRLPRTLRVGHTLMSFVKDVRPFLARPGVDTSGGLVVGPVLWVAHQRIARAAASGDTLLLTGPSGCGKELAARLFHESSPRSAGPFVPINCSAIPVGLAERLFFGAQRGTYSGATSDAEGYIQGAHRGVLFLDEIAELDPGVQPKLLRVLETHEVLALGAVHPRKAEFQLCAATLKDLQVEVAAGRFREDLYFRINSPEVRLPALAERVEEIPWLASQELRRLDPRLTPACSLLECSALAPWPGNVRQFLGEIREAGRTALEGGRTVVERKDLPLAQGESGEARAGTGPLPREPPLAAIEAALRGAQGNVTGAARALGMHRNQLRRWLTRHGVEPKSFTPADQKTQPE